MSRRFFSLSSAAVAALSINLAAAQDVPAASAAEHDEALATTQMATRYEHAEGVPRNLQLAAQLYCRAARVGRAEAQYKLGWMYANGRGVARDDGIAAALFAMAAAQGHAQSERILMYVRPRAATPLPACLAVAEWVPSLKLSVALAAGETADAAGKLQHGLAAGRTTYSAMQAEAPAQTTPGRH